ncbi:MAG TPA: hypothetical protein VJ952_04315 [Opitutales bacterium]|nr:hypothetical protein [Opitutales bacterium]
MKASQNKRHTALKKRPRVKQVLPSQCLVCNNPEGYTAKETTQDIEFRGEPFRVTYTHLVCQECGNAILSDEQLTDRIKKVVAAYQRRHGLLTGEELIRQRKSLGYNSQRALLRAAPELSEATLKRIEAGMHAQDASTDALFDKVLKNLEKQQIMKLLNEPLSPPVETSDVQVSGTSQSMWDPLAAAACVTFAAGSMLLSTGNRIANRDCETSYNEVRIESC